MSQTASKMPSQTAPVALPFKVAIIGAGPAGCCLARILTESPGACRSLCVTVFEGETSLDVRAQGGSLDLRQNTGLAAIRAAKLEDEFMKHARFDGDSIVLCDKHMTRYMSKTASKEDKKGSKPEIDRLKLRQLLIDSLPPDTIKWGKKLKEAREEPNGTYSLAFHDESVARDFDLVVGADGAWSQVRPLVTDVKPLYSGVSGHLWRIEKASKVIPETWKMVNHGTYASLDDTKMLGLQAMDDDMLHSSTWFPESDENWVEKAPYDVKDPAAIRKYNLEQRFGEWSPGLKKGIENATLSRTLTLTLYMLPLDHQWKHRRGVTLIGDAAHLMTPFGGEGVNQALADSETLAAKIIDAIADADERPSSKRLADAVHSGVERFEREMFLRVHPVMRKTNENKELVFLTPGGLRSKIEKLILLVLEDKLPLKFITFPLAMALVYTYCFFFKLFH